MCNPSYANLVKSRKTVRACVVRACVRACVSASLYNTMISINVADVTWIYQGMMIVDYRSKVKGQGHHV